MIIEPSAAQRFIEGYKAVLLELHRVSGEPAHKDVIATLASARSYLKENPQSLVSALAKLEAAGTPVASDVQMAIESLRIEQWVYLRRTTRYSIFIDHAVENAYAVLGLTNTITEFVGGTAVTFEAAIFCFEGRYVCDGIVRRPVFLGTGYRAQFNAALTAIKQRGRFHAKCKA
jgi:hypothetical protein